MILGQQTSGDKNSDPKGYLMIKFPSQHIQYVPPEQLLLCVKNPRTHSEAQHAQLADSIERFGFLNPVLVDSEWRIVAGHARIHVAKVLKLKEIPIIVVDHLSEAEKLAYMLADNQIATLASWDDPKLYEILAGLDEDLRKAAGFNEQEFEQLAADLEEELGKTDEDEVPKTAPFAVSAPDDLWILGNHRVLCGDATVIAAIEHVMGGDRAAMTFTDPPYNVAYEQRTKTSGPRSITNDNLGVAFEPFLYDACVNILSVTNGAVYICMASAELHHLYTAFTRAGGHWSTFLIWSKDHFTLGRADFQRAYEPILYGWPRGKEHYWCGARNQGDVWQVPRPRSNKLHPTAKPIALVERAIANSSRAGDIVLDPFAGSGSVVISCQRTRRHARVIELEPTFVDVIIRRWQEFTGKTAVLEGQGKTFAEMADARLRKAA
jgi:DNA modification methylase